MASTVTIEFKLDLTRAEEQDIYARLQGIASASRARSTASVVKTLVLDCTPGYEALGYLSLARRQEQIRSAMVGAPQAFGVPAETVAAVASKPEFAPRPVEGGFSL
jgi:hypothetical protein